MGWRFPAAIIFLSAALGLAGGSAWAIPIGFTVNSDTDLPQRQLYSVDLATGEAIAVGPVGFVDVEGLSFSPDGVLYGVDDATNRLITLNLATGAGSLVGNLGLPDTTITQPSDFGMSFDCEGVLWLSSDQTESLYTVDPETGAASIVGASGALGVSITGLATSGDVLYGLGAEGAEGLYRIDKSTGAATAVGALGAGLSFNDGGLAFDPSGSLWGIADNSNPEFPPSDVFWINNLTGAATVISATLTGAESLAISGPVGCEGGNFPGRGEGQPVPALTAWGVWGMFFGLAGVAWLRLRRRRD